MSLLKLEVIGHLGKDAEIKDVSGKCVIEFSVAHSVKQKDNTYLSTWVKCSYWRESRDKCAIANYLKKGGQVFVMGEPSVGAYMDKNNQPQTDLRLRVSEIVLLGSKSESNTTNDNQPTNNTPTTKGSDDLPF
jgi:single-strand DNA-binding protein